MEIKSNYPGEMTLITPVDEELSETKREAKRQLLEMLEPASAMQRQKARQLISIIER